MNRTLLCVLLLASSNLSHAQCNLVTNGDFSAGTSGFTTAYSRALLPSKTPQASGGLYSPGSYSIVSNIHDNNVYFNNCTYKGNMMVVNAATIPDKAVWGQTVSVLPHTTYIFSVEATSAMASNPARLVLSVNGSSADPVTLGTNPCFWQTLTFLWHSGTNTSAALAITDSNLARNGNDFALDNIAFYPTSGPAVAVRGTTDASFCECPVIPTGSISLSITGIAPYTYSVNEGPWTEFSIPEVITGLQPMQRYNVRVKDACGNISKGIAPIYIGKKMPVMHFTGSAQTPAAIICVDSSEVATHVERHTRHNDPKQHDYIVDACANEAIADGASRISIVPNPSQGIFQVSFPRLEGTAAMLIRDAQGRMIRNVPVPDGATSLEVNLTAQGRGLYFITVSDGISTYKAKAVTQ